MMRIRWKQAVIAGLIATAVMTAVGIFAAPVMGLPAMNPAEMLAMQMGGVLGAIYGPPSPARELAQPPAGGVHAAR